MEDDILFKELCARLPYGIILYKDGQKYTLTGINKSKLLVIRNINTNAISTTTIDTVKPYLFPISSMTEEQCEELYNISAVKDWCTPNIRIKVYSNTIEWFLKNRFDYRNLIPIKLAIDATDLNIY